MPYSGGLPTQVVQTATGDGTMFFFDHIPGQVFVDSDLTAYYGGGEGRCLAYDTCAYGLISNCTFRSGDDDALSLQNDCRGTVVINCTFPVADYSVSNKAFTLGGDPLMDTTIISASLGYAGTFINCDFDGQLGAGRIWGGVWNFINCTIRVSALAGFSVFGGKVNFIDCNFVTQSAPAGAPYWYLNNDPCCVRVAGFDVPSETVDDTQIGDVALYFKDCTLNGAAITKGLDICRKYNASTGYDAYGNLPVAIVKTTPITE